MAHGSGSGNRARPPRRATTALTGAAVVIGVAVTGCTSGPRAEGPAAASPTASPAASPTASADAPLILENQPENVHLEPGRYVADPFDAPPDASWRAVLTVPEGFGPVGGAGVLADEHTHSVVWLWDITRVFTHPCAADGVDQVVGPTVADLGGALAAQPMREGTAPVPVTVGGYDGLYVELSTPDDLDFATCREGYFHMWPGRSDRAPGQVDRLWIVDVDGQRITFDLSHPPTADPELVRELEEIVTTATFIRRQGA